MDGYWEMQRIQKKKDAVIYMYWRKEQDTAKWKPIMLPISHIYRQNHEYAGQVWVTERHSIFGYREWCYVEFCFPTNLQKHMHSNSTATATKQHVSCGLLSIEITELLLAMLVNVGQFVRDYVPWKNMKLENILD